jgi:hypothetical protein
MSYFDFSYEVGPGPTSDEGYFLARSRTLGFPSLMLGSRFLLAPQNTYWQLALQRGAILIWQRLID